MFLLFLQISLKSVHVLNYVPPHKNMWKCGTTAPEILDVDTRVRRVNVLSSNPKFSYVTCHSSYPANLVTLYIAYGVKHVRRFGECGLPLLLSNLTSYRYFMHVFRD